MRNTLNSLVSGHDLSRSEMEAAMTAIMDGECTPAQIACFITALRMKGETIAELTGAASVMRQHAHYIDGGPRSIVDTCGTGGDGGNTFNISTTTAFVVAGAGICVAKHGNRAVSSQCGSADVLGELGLNLEAEPAVMEQCLQEDGIAFLYAPKLHPAMRYAAPVRRDLGIRTIFNMLGPLTNPAGATGQVLGVFSPELTEPFAHVLQGLGTRRAFVVHGLDGLDEISVCDFTRISELRDGLVRTYEFSAERHFGQFDDPADLAGGDAATNAAILRRVLEGEDGAPRRVVLLNAAAAIVTAEKADTIDEGLQLAAQSIDSGAALAKLETLIEACR
jgi:anthranilate phosphoribosyltransferase